MWNVSTIEYTKSYMRKKIVLKTENSSDMKQPKKQ